MKLYIEVILAVRAYYENDVLIQSVSKRSNQLVGIDRCYTGAEKLLFNHNASSESIVSKSTKISCYSFLNESAENDLKGAIKCFYA